MSSQFTGHNFVTKHTIDPGALRLTVALVVGHSGDDVVPLNKLWRALKPLLLRSDLSSEAVLAAKQAVDSRDADEMVDVGEFVLELIALQEEHVADEGSVDTGEAGP